MRIFVMARTLFTLLILMSFLAACGPEQKDDDSKDEEKTEQNETENKDKDKEKEDKDSKDKDKPAKGDDEEEEKEERSVPVEVAEVTTGNVFASYQTTATLETEHSTDVVAKAEGVVLKLLVEEGDTVKAGQVLAELDRDKLLLDSRKAKVVLQRLKADLKRADELFKKKLGSSEAFDKARYEYKQQQIAVETIALELSYTLIKAPIDGVITNRMIHAGNLVKRYDAVFHIEDFKYLQAILHVPERQLRVLRTNLPVQMQADALGEEVFTGTIERISPVINQKTGTFKVTVQLQNEGQAMRSGMFVRLHLIYDEHNGVMLIPIDAILSEDGGEAVFRVKDEKVERVVIQTSYKNKNDVEVTSGLELGDKIITLGKSALREGSKVSIIEKAQ